MGDAPSAQRIQVGRSTWTSPLPSAEASAWLASVATAMPATIGSGLRLRAASSSASSGVLPPISPSATTPVEAAAASSIAGPSGPFAARGACLGPHHLGAMRSPGRMS
jgi:hypothetical protein